MSLLKLISTTAILLAGFTTFSQDVLWAEQYGGTMYDLVTSTKIDSDNNQIISGSFQSTIELGMGGPSSTLTSAGIINAYVAKYDGDANITWAFSIESTGLVFIEDCVIDNDNNILVIGNLEGTADFDPSVGVENLSSFGPDNRDFFVAKYSPLGDLIWAKSFGDDQFESATDITIDVSGNCYVIGEFRGVFYMDPVAGEGLVASSTDDESAIFLLKLNADGDFADAHHYWRAYPGDIEVDVDGNVFVSGSSFGATDYDLAYGVSHYISPLNSANGFIVKNSSTFDFEWVYIVDDASGIRHNVGDIVIEESGNIHGSGTFRGTVDFDPSVATVSLTATDPIDRPYNVKLNADGSLEWVHSSVILSDTYIDADNNLYSAGSFAGTVDFDPGAGIINYTSPSDYLDEDTGSGFVQKMDEDGNLLWVKIMQPGAMGFTHIKSLSVDSDKNVYAAGLYSDSVYVNTSPVSEFETFGSYDCYIAKFGEACDIDISTSIAGITLTVAESGATYQWLDCDDAFAEIPGETNQSFTATDNGNYACEITLGACVEISACTEITTVGLAERVQFDFDVYPNPTTGLITLNTTEFVQSSLYNTKGELILTTTENQIDLSAFSSGLYILKAATDKGVVIRKIQLR